MIVTVEFENGSVIFEFLGKSGQEHRVELKDAKLAQLVRQCRDLDGDCLFRYEDAGELRTATSEDVNRYLAEQTNSLMTAKDFRLWRGTVHVASAMRGTEKDLSATQLKRCLSGLIRDAAGELGNTATVCRKYYVDNLLQERFAAGEFARLERGFQSRRLQRMSADEQFLMHVLKRL